MHLPPHPIWYWLLVAGPFVAWLALWAIATFTQLSLKPLISWLRVAFFLTAPVYLVVSALDGHKALRMVCSSVFYSCMISLLTTQRRYQFAIIRWPHPVWNAPWKSAEFSIPTDMRISVKSIHSASEWYTQRLGLLKQADDQPERKEVVTYRFREDGKSIVLTTKPDFRTGRTPIFFTKKITHMKDVLSARGIDTGTITKDRQGIRFFEIHDPEGNVIEVVEEP
jgi:hypothetical protein